MADEAAVQQAQADYERRVAELQARAEKAESEAKAARDAGQAWEQKYQTEMDQVRNYLQQVQAAYQQTVAQAQAKPAAEEPEDAIATTKTVKDAINAMQQSMAQQVAQTIGQQQIQLWREARMRNRTAALNDSRLTGIGEMIGDIDTLLDRVPPQGAASDDAYRQAYAVVLGARQMQQQEEAARQAAAAPPPSDDDEDETPAPAAAPAAAPARPAPGHFGGAMPAPSAMAAASRGRAPAREPVDEYEASVIQRHYGGDRKAYLRDLGLTKANVAGADPYDVLDMKGRTKV